MSITKLANILKFILLQIPSNVIEAINCPEFCSGNGKCDIVGTGGCLCNEDYTGTSCDKLVTPTLKIGHSNVSCNSGNDIR